MSEPEPRTGPEASGRPPGSFRLGTIAGSEVRITSSWFLVAALIAFVMAPRVDEVQPGLGAWKYLVGFTFAVVLYLAVLLHEASHALWPAATGSSVESITLHFLGGMTAIEGEARTPRQEFWIAVVGPLTSIAVGAAALGALFVTPDGLLRLAVRGAGGRQPPDRRAQPGAGPAARRRPGAEGRRVGRDRPGRTPGPSPPGGAGAWSPPSRAAAGPLSLERLHRHAVTDVLDFMLAFVIAAFLWSGASQRSTSARVRRRLPALVARDLARRTLAVPDDLPLAEAVRRAQEAEAGGIVTVTAAGSPVGVVNEEALRATPADRRPWVPVSTVARTARGGSAAPGRHHRRGAAAGDQRPTPRAEYLLVEPTARSTACSPPPTSTGRSRGLIRVGRGRVRPVSETSPDVPPDAWSGVHRGPLRAGEWVRLTDTKGRRHNFCLEPGKRFFSNKGHLDHDELIGREEGFTVTSSAGGEYLVFRPLLSEYVVSMPRGAAVVYPKDAAQIIAMVDVFPGAHVVEAGVGSGALTCSLLRAVARTAGCRRTSGGRSSPRSRAATSEQFFGRRPPRVVADHRRPRRGAAGVRASGATGSSSTCWRPGTASTPRPARSRPGGIVCAYVATTTQLSRFVETVRVHGGFTEPQAWESLVRDWHVEGLAVRPGHSMIGHTAFLVTARRMAPGQPPAVKKRRPAPGAYGPDYTGPAARHRA